MAKKTTQKGNDDIIAKLQEDPSKQNWERAREKILSDGKYYYAFYPNGIQGAMSLKGAYALIYDKNFKSLYNVPVTKRVGKGVEGATWYLKGLQINRRVIKG